MERKESRNGLELIKYASIRLRGNFSALFLGTLAMVTPLVLVILVPFIMSMITEIGWILSIGIVLFAILVGPLQIGYMRYFDETIAGKQPKISRVYSQLKFEVQTLRVIYISVILFAMYIVGGILWIVPAGFAISFYSMSLFFLEKNKYTRMTVAMKDCAQSMIGNRLAMFAYKLIFYLVYFLAFVVGALCLALVVLLAIDSLLVSWIVAVCSAIIFIFIYTMITVYYHSCNQIFFEDVLIRKEKKKAKLSSTEEKVENTENAVVEEVEETKTKKKEKKKVKEKKEKKSKAEPENKA